MTYAPALPGYLADLTGLVEIDLDRGVYLFDPPIAPRKGDTNPTFVHWCTRPEGLDGKPMFPRFVLCGTGDHTVHSRDPWHLEASLLCPDCEFHGWIRDGRWVSA